jgi:hypothetical protein
MSLSETPKQQRLSAAKTTEKVPILISSVEHYAEPKARANQEMMLPDRSGFFKQLMNDTNAEEAFRKADGLCTAEDEPDSLNDWREDSNQLDSDLYAYVSTGINESAKPSDPTMKSLEDNFSGDLKKAKKMSRI